MTKKILLLLLLCMLALPVSTTLAADYKDCNFQSGSPKDGIMLPQDCKPTGVADTPGRAYDSKDIQNWVNVLLNTLFPILGLLAVFFIVQNGFNMVAKSFNESKVKEAQKGITWAILGLLATILAYAVITSIIKFVYLIG